LNGQGDFSSSYGTPTRIGTETNWTQVCASTERSLALKHDGSLWGWGYNIYGQLGDGTTNSRSLPTMIGTDRDWKLVAAGSFNSYALKSNGTLWGWGAGTNSTNFTPRQIGTDTNWLTVSAYNFTMLALRTDGTPWLNCASCVASGRTRLSKSSNCASFDFFVSFFII
jgi:hypothetical protein